MSSDIVYGHVERYVAAHLGRDPWIPLKLRDIALYVLEEGIVGSLDEDARKEVGPAVSLALGGNFQNMPKFTSDVVDRTREVRATVEDNYSALGLEPFGLRIAYFCSFSARPQYQQVDYLSKLMSVVEMEFGGEAWSLNQLWPALASQGRPNVKPTDFVKGAVRDLVREGRLRVKENGSGAMHYQKC